MRAFSAAIAAAILWMGQDCHAEPRPRPPGDLPPSSGGNMEGNRSTEHFGGWVLESISYGTAFPRLHQPSGVIRLSFRTRDGLVRWRLETEGAAVRLFADLGAGPKSEAGIVSWLKAFPTRARELIRIAEGQLDPATFPPQPKPALRDILAKTRTYRAELKASSDDLDRALWAMESGVR